MRTPFGVGLSNTPKLAFVTLTTDVGRNVHVRSKSRSYGKYGSPSWRRPDSRAKKTVFETPERNGLKHRIPSKKESNQGR